MDEFMSVLTKSNDIDQLNGEHIKAHLKSVVSRDIYDKWIVYFVFEEVNEEQIVIGYYGTASLRKFEKKYKKMVWLEICSYIGCVKKLNICKRKKQPEKARVDELTADSNNNIEKPVAKNADVDKKNSGIKSIFKNPLQIIKVLIIFGIIAGIVGVSAILGINYISNKTFVENFYNVGCIKANEKIRIIQISDLHNSVYGEENSLLIERVEKLKPDIIIFTGDCVEPDEASVKATIKMCSALAKVAPSYYVYGNNEVELVYSFPLSKDALDEKFGFDDDNRSSEKLMAMKDSLEERLEKAGVTVLKDEKVSIKVDSTNVDIYGSLISNPSAFWPYSGDSFADFIYSDESHLKVFAIHEPFVFEELESEFWGDIMLCGHTHGGLVKVPIIGPLYTPEGGLFPERNDCYVSGRYSVAERPLIVSSGLENKDFLRINNKPELTIIDINKF